MSFPEAKQHLPLCVRKGALQGTAGTRDRDPSHRLFNLGSATNSRPYCGLRKRLLHQVKVSKSVANVYRTCSLDPLSINPHNSPLREYYYYPCFTGKGTEAQRGLATCSRSHSNYVSELGFIRQPLISGLGLPGLLGLCVCWWGWGWGGVVVPRAE